MHIMNYIRILYEKGRLTEKIMRPMGGGRPHCHSPLNRPLAQHKENGRVDLLYMHALIVIIVMHCTVFVRIVIMSCIWHWQYAVAIDAGSSHTSLFVYKWPKHSHKHSGDVQQVLKCPKEHSQCLLQQCWLINSYIINYWLLIRPT